MLGDNSYGQLGDGTHYRPGATPTDVVGRGPARDHQWRVNHTCAVLADGGAQCWGDNEYGQLGDGTRDDHLTPVDVVGLQHDVTGLSAGYEHTSAVTDAGGAKCWGDNHSGQLGDGTTTRRLTPVDVLMFDCADVSEIPQSECRALVALYDRTAITGRPWTHSSGWLRTATPCSWYGVTCADGHVTGLNLHSNNLGGALPPELGDLAGLQTLTCATMMSSWGPSRRSSAGSPP